MYKHILVPTDGSDLSAKASAAAIELAKSSGARVTGFCVVVDTPVAAGIGKTLRDKDGAIQAADEYLSVISRQAREAGVPCECYHIVAAWPHDEIVKMAEAKGCDLIHMASQGKGMIERFFLGSEAAQVVKSSKVPVLVYR